MSNKTPITPDNGFNKNANTQNSNENKIVAKVEKVNNKPQSNEKNATTAKNTSSRSYDEKQTNKNPQTNVKSSSNKTDTNNVTEPTSKNKKEEKKSGSGKGLAVLAILIALGLGAGGYYFAMQKYNSVRQQIEALKQQVAQSSANQQILSSDKNGNESQNNAINVAIENLTQVQQTQSDKLAAAEKRLALTNQELKTLSNNIDLEKAQNNELRNQINKLSFNTGADNSNWLMSEADFLLKNAQQKLILDGDVSTVVSLLQSADQTLQKVQNSQAVALRTAINQDIKQLQSVNEVDQDFIMSKLSVLISQVDNLSVLSPNTTRDSAEVSDSINDWQQNLANSANSFLDHFIRISKKEDNSPELLAPDQDVYLKENIRLNLQIALMAVPRQQNEVYKQSLNSVAVWIRSYFDTDNASVQQFLQQVDQLKELSIYVDIPQELSSLKIINAVINNEPAVSNKSTDLEKSATKNDAQAASKSE